MIFKSSCVNKARHAVVAGRRTGVFAVLAIALWNPAFTSPKKFFLADEGKGKIHFIDLEDGSKSWTTASPVGTIRDLQLVGDNRIMLGVENGFAEFDVVTGKLLRHKAVYSNVGSVRRLANGNTFVTQKDNAKVIVVDTSGKQVSSITLEKAAHRLMRLTEKGNFIYGNGADVIEADPSGKVVWSASVKPAANEVYAAIRVSGNCVWVTTGYDKSLFRIDSLKNVTKYTAATGDKPNEFAGFQVLPGGKIAVANWQGHGDGHGAQGHQFLQFDIGNKTVDWFWAQEAARISSINNILVSDGLDPKYLHTDAGGELKPIGGNVGVCPERAERPFGRGARSPGMTTAPERIWPIGVYRCINLRGSSVAASAMKGAAAPGVYLLFPPPAMTYGKWISVH